MKKLFTPEQKNDTSREAERGTCFPLKNEKNHNQGEQVPEQRDLTF